MTTFLTAFACGLFLWTNATSALQGGGMMASVEYEAPAPIAVSSPVDPGEYIVGPGDILWLSAEGGLPTAFFPAGGASVVYLQVMPDGSVVIPFVGGVRAGGLTLEQASENVVAAVSERFRGVRPEAGLAGVRVSRIPVTGEVLNPGIVNVAGTNRLSDAINSAGGLCPGASLTRVEIRHQSGDCTVVDFSRFRLEGDMSCNPPLAPGDMIHVPPAAAFVEVSGAVFARGPFPLDRTESGSWIEGSRTVMEYLENETVSQCIARAGGIAPWAVPDSIYIERLSDDGSLVRLSAGPHPSGMTLLPGDRVICPGSTNTVAVTGFVQAPGVFQWVAGSDAWYYIALAGGLTNEGSRSGVSVSVPGGEDDDPDRAGPLPPGSVIEVPRKTLVWWQDYLAVLTGVASVVIAYESIF